ncbi:hypothetical protein CK203_028495 [Vitis vinifera]|uniref:EF-hand domain-containing protein n=2 Tax=Vitis vinifera TaxID=29760 RepID=F6HG73_VITVI|nr:hypothetical protein CK203_028495 [Vitis vinifera]
MINCSIYERIFKRFDEDGDGKLSPSELRRCVETIGGGAADGGGAGGGGVDGLRRGWVGGVGGICGVDGERGRREKDGGVERGF